MRHRPTLALLAGTALTLPGLTQTRTGDAALLATACNTFAADLHARLAGKGAPDAGPGSIALALLMLLPGTRGPTEQEIATVLHLPADLRGARLHAAAQRLIEDLDLGGKGRHDTDGPMLRIANDLWTQDGFPVVAEYRHLLTASYGAMHHALDFVGDPAGALRTINAHVAGLTNQRIPELLTPDLITPQTCVVITNAMWLKAQWQHAFPASSTSPAAFTLADGTAADVPMMHTTESFDYAETDAWQSLVLPFAHCQLVCELVLPRPGHELAAAERVLLTDGHAGALRREVVRVDLPRFRVAGSHRLAKVLAAMGMPSAFDPTRADFTGLTAQRKLVVDDVVHQVWVQVDETGAEAAAATAIVMKRGSKPTAGKPKVFTADRPFAFVLRDRTTGLVLFHGRVTDPRLAPAAARPVR